jgi:regulator of sigma E protease
MSWFLAFVGFAALIVLHELGHFIAAKAVGMRVERFMLFFPPIIWSVKRGETEYGIGAIPLGGYVRISGMNPREELPPEVEPRAYYKQKPWKRIVVILAGPAMNLLIAFVLFWGIFAFSDRFEPTDKIGKITAGAPAAEVLKPGDRLVAVDGVRGDTERLREQIATHTCPGDPTPGCLGTPLKLTVERGGRTTELTARPKYDASIKRPLLGFQFDTRTVNDNGIEAVGSAASSMWDITTGTVSAIGKLFYDEKARNDVSGVVGSYETTRQAIGLSATAAFYLLAVISLSLAIVNLFPFLPLDGGHVFWALAEKVRGKPIPFTVMERAGIVGFVLVGLLFFLGLTNDIDRLRGEGFGIR